MHVSLDSALGRQRRLNSVGESVLQIAPSATAAYSLRSLTGGDPKVVRVRRDTDNAEQDFTASGVSSGALTSFTNADYAKYTSDFSSGDDSWGSFDDVTETGNIDGIGGLDNNLRLAIGSATSQHRGFRSNVFPAGQKINFSARVFIPSTNSVVDSLGIRDASGTVVIAAGTAPAQDQWVTVTANDVTVTNKQLRVDLQDGGVNTFAGNGSDVIYLREVTVTQVTSDGFVETWYDQSGNSNDAVQATAESQPKIVNAGALLADGIDFDGSDDTLTAASVSGFGATVSLFEASIRDGGAAAVVSMGSSAATTNTNFGLVEAGSNTQASVRNTTSRTVNASVSGETRLGFAVTTGQTSTKVGALGGTLVETTDDYGDDFTSGELDTIFLGKIRGGSSTEFNGHIREALVYNTDQSANRDAVEANIANHYNITLV